MNENQTTLLVAALVLLMIVLVIWGIVLIPNDPTMCLPYR